MRSARGSVLVIVAVSLLVLGAISALAVDVGFMYDLKNKLGAVADDAAKSAAVEVHRGNGVHMVAFAQHEVDAATFLGTIPAGVTMDAHFCDAVGATCDAAYTNHQYVEVILDKTQDTFFGNVMGIASMTPKGRAVAGVSGSSHCLVSLNGVSWENGNTVNATNCDVEIGGNANLGNGTAIISQSTGVAGARTGGGTYTPPAVTIPPISDPMADVPAMADPGGVCTALTITADQAIFPGKYCSWHFDSSATLTLNPGQYYITGLIDDKNSGTDVIINGTGVFLYLAGPDGQISFASNHLTMTLSAQTFGAYKGIIFFQARGNTNAADFGKNGNAGGLSMDGGMYFPSATVGMKNHSTPNHCGFIVAGSVEMKNGEVLTFDDACSSFGGSPIHTTSLAE